MLETQAKVRKTYSQDWTSYNKAQTNEKRLFQSILSELCDQLDIAEPVQLGPGRRNLSIRDMLFSSAFKVYCGSSARRFACDLEDAYTKRHISHLPHFNSVLRYLDNPALTEYLDELVKRSAIPLIPIEEKFAVDSSGFSISKYDRWFTEKWGGEIDGDGEPVLKQEEKSRQQWLKLHIICGVTTNVITAARITEKNSNDYPHLPDLIQSTKIAGFDLQEVSADKAYSGNGNIFAIVKAGAAPYIMFKDNANGASGGIFAAAFHYYSLNKAEFKRHYHNRSNVETTFSMIKAKFDGFVRGKNPVAQKNELLCKVICHNICCLVQSMFEFGVDLELKVNEKVTEKSALYLVK